MNQRLTSMVRRAFRALGLEVTRRPKVGPRAGPHYIITPLVAERLRRGGQRFVVLDGGAGSESDFFSEIWSGLGSDLVTVYGFEVDRDDCERLNEEARRRGKDYHYFPFGLRRERGQETFIQTRVPGGSSFYPANEQLVRRWRYGDGRKMTDVLSPEKEWKVDVTSIEAWRREFDAFELDFMKLNVQGGELEILQGAGPHLDTVLGIQLEMSFRQTYLGTPLFSDIDPILRRRGFTFFDILSENFVGSEESPIRVSIPAEVHNFRWPSQQCFEGHFLYFRDLIGSPETDEQKLIEHPTLKLAAMAEMYGQVEYAFELLVALARRLRERDLKEDASEISAIIETATKRYSAYL
jgi:FkbM family methyltransferase